MDDTEFKEHCQESVIAAFAEAVPDKQIAIEIILALVSVAIQLWATCYNKKQAAMLIRQASAHPHGLASMKVRSKLKAAIEANPAIPAEYHDILLKPLINSFAIKCADPKFINGLVK